MSHAFAIGSFCFFSRDAARLSLSGEIMSSLIKLGPLNINRERWLDALEVFDGVHVVRLTNDSEPEIGEGFQYHYLPKNVINTLLVKACGFSKKRKWCKLFSYFGIGLLRLINYNWVKKIVSIDAQEVLSSYNDFDESGILTVMLAESLKASGKHITRAYKETRPEFDAFEIGAFYHSDRIVLNAPECIEFFKNKWGDDVFKDKEIISNLDEDWLSQYEISSIVKKKKLSEFDGRLHAVILAGRVMSDCSDKRSGSRLYYIPLICELLESGIAVHLHTLRIINDVNGVNQYEVLKAKYPDAFYIESPLPMEGETIADSISLLSRYDLGIMHNYVDGTSNTAFDRYNIPHRYYEYEAAGVAPILQRGRAFVMERILKENCSGIIYSQLSEIKTVPDLAFQTPTFKEYIESLYPQEYQD